jgi:hypothetical protein
MGVTGTVLLCSRRCVSALFPTHWFRGRPPTPFQGNGAVAHTAPEPGQTCCAEKLSWAIGLKVLFGAYSINKPILKVV